MIINNIYPTFKEFCACSRKGNLIPVAVDVVADQITPVSLISSQWKSNSHCFLLESVEGGEKLGRYSIVSFQPEAIFERRDGKCTLRSPVGEMIYESRNSTLDTLRNHLKAVKPVVPPGLPRFFGGAVGYCAYETIHEIERLPRTKPDNLHWPQAFFFITGDLFIFDNTQQLLKLITHVHIGRRTNVKKAYEAARGRLLNNLKLLRRVMASSKKASHRSPDRRSLGDFKSNMSQKRFMDMVKKGKKYIYKGDVIQVVLSRRISKDSSASPLDIYRCLRVVNPSPYMYLIKMKDRAIIGSSPESLVRLEKGLAATRPIAGTRHRGANAQEDKILEKELLKDPKERAEHVMLVDLGRNDLGRVCEKGTVHVPTFMTIERYSHVMHIVSEVTGKLRGDQDAFDLLKASFPAGTVAGAPKIRAMEIIDELEVDQRGPYAGALGYFSYSGNMDMAITIRTILWDKGRVSIQTGAGIVADSNPNREYLETENKAAGMKKTIELAERGELFLDPL
ncbi:MAG: anthranilate synthase component I [Elusimicrobia bacterium]|nr:anthranilate synthase component I [Candidatus Obscuribacterium magneticum]